MFRFCLDGILEASLISLSPKASITRSLFNRHDQVFPRPCKWAWRFPRRPYTRPIFRVEKLACRLFDKDLVTRKNREFVAIYAARKKRSCKRGLRQFLRPVYMRTCNIWNALSASRDILGTVLISVHLHSAKRHLSLQTKTSRTGFSQLGL